MRWFHRSAGKISHIGDWLDFSHANHIRDSYVHLGNAHLHAPSGHLDCRDYEICLLRVDPN